MFVDWLVVLRLFFFWIFGGFKHCWLAFLCAILAVAQPPPIIRYHLVILGPSNTKHKKWCDSYWIIVQDRKWIFITIALNKEVPQSQGHIYILCHYKIIISFEMFWGCKWQPCKDKPFISHETMMRLITFKFRCCTLEVYGWLRHGRHGKSGLTWNFWLTSNVVLSTMRFINLWTHHFHLNVLIFFPMHLFKHIQVND